MGRKLFPKFLIPHCQEKPLVRLQVPVPETDTGRRGENPKVSGRTLVKELGKMTPYFGRRGASRYEKHPFSRSYGVVLPRALRRVVPVSSGFSPLLPLPVL